MQQPTEFMTSAEVAQLTRAPESTVRYWRHCGTGPQSFRVGRRVIYRRAEVDQWIAACEQADRFARANEPEETTWAR